MSRTLVCASLAGAFVSACTASDEAIVNDERSPLLSSKPSELRVRQTNLTSDQSGVAAHTVPELINAWGLAVNPEPATGPEFWIAANGTNMLVVMAADGSPTGRTVSVTGPPTGLVHTESSDFRGDEFILDTEAGTIEGWQEAAGNSSVVRVDNSASGAVYKGLAVFKRRGNATLAATDFHGGKVDVYGPGYTKIDHAGFVDAQIPAGFAPFGIALLGNEIYVSYAKQDADAHDDVAGPGNGFVDVFHRNGRLKRRLISRGQLNSPWGMALVPSGFGSLSHMLLVGNFGDGAINVYDPHSGVFRGQLHAESGEPLAIDGLWSLVVGPKTDAADLRDRLFFTAGPDHEAHGLFGTLQPVKEK